MGSCPDTDIDPKSVRIVDSCTCKNFKLDLTASLSQYYNYIIYFRNLIGQYKRVPFVAKTF